MNLNISLPSKSNLFGYAYCKSISLQPIVDTLDMTKNVISAVWPKPVDNRNGRVLVDPIKSSIQRDNATIYLSVLLYLPKHDLDTTCQVKKKTHNNNNNMVESARGQTHGVIWICTTLYKIKCLV